MIKTDFSLLHYNSFGIDVKAKRFVEYSTVEELKNLILSGDISEPYFHIGGGSNLLFTKDYPGTILHSRIGGITVVREDVESVWLKVGAGINWDRFVAYCVDHDWYGLENLSLIPGEVGASAVQNIGAYGVEIKDFIESVETINSFGESHTYTNADCKYSYRNSIFKHKDMKNVFVTYVYYKLSKIRKFTLTYNALRDEFEALSVRTLPEVRSLVISIRKRKLPDPNILGNAGSFFMNPVIRKSRLPEFLKMYPNMPFYEQPNDFIKLSAGWLIEQCGWKGKNMGAAGVYEKQALVLVNRGGATGTDILSLSDAVRKSVHDKFGVDICPEVNIL